MEFIFWIVFIGTIYSYFIYPVLLFLMKKRALPPSSLNKDDAQSVTLIITVHNEEARIAQKLDNALAIDYPSSQFEIMLPLMRLLITHMKLSLNMKMRVVV